MFQHGAAEPVGELEIERQVEAVTPAGEVVVELARRAIQPAGCEQDPRAHPLRQRGEDGIVILHGERDPYQPCRRRGEEQRAHRRIDGSVGDVEQVLLLRAVGQQVTKPVQVRVG